jgi:hypothetical protein
MRRTLALLAPLVLLGCGGGKSDAVAKADAICRDVSGKINKLDKPQTRADVAKYVAQSQAIERDGVRRLKALTPSDDKRAAFTAYESAITRLVDLSRQTASAVIANDASRQQRLTARAGPLTLKAVAAARRAGFKDCSQ